MALKVTTLKEEEQMASKWIANRDLYTDGDGDAVEAGDPKSAFLLVRKGRPLSAEQMERHKVKKSKPRKVKK